ncbi:MAG: hypothetical protein P1U53_01205 [Sulfitobacter sp.]|nr:hypothetical protein [Sulfitobacter sp.]
MTHPTKIATCCYCHSTTALRLDAGAHELSCASCGAPLRQIKMLPQSRPRKAVSHQPAVRSFPTKPAAAQVKRKKPKKVKKRKHWLRGLAEEAFDIVEDIFD